MSRPPRAAPTIHDELGSHGQSPGLLAAANAREFVLVAAQQEKPSSSPPCASRRTGGLVEIAEDKVLVTGLKGPPEQGWQQKAGAFVAPRPPPALIAEL